MKYILIDVNTNVILAETLDKKIAAMCQSVVQDTNLTFLLPGFHSHIYQQVDNKNLGNEIIKFYSGNIIKVDTLFPSIDGKIKLTQTKMSLIQHLLVGAEGNMLYKNYLFDNEFVSIVQSNNHKLIEEYSLIRKLPITEAKKEIDIKISNYQTAVVKIQALIDRWMEIITTEDNIDILQGYKKDIIDSFFYIDQ
jgi:hypothetical protein